MKLKIRKIDELVSKEINEEKYKDCPLPIGVIPNYMGINLCSVDSISWRELDNGELLDLTINFLPKALSELKNA